VHTESITYSAMNLVLNLVLIALSVRIFSAVQCQYCYGEFASLGRHVWRCKARGTSAATPIVPTEHNIASVDAEISQETILGAAENLLPSSVKDEQCVCGKKCKGPRGLKAHQRSCHTFKTLVTRNPLPQDVLQNHRNKHRWI